MNEIKFKFAGQLQEKWIISRPFTLGELNIGWVSQFAANENLKMAHLIPLQFTGLKDKQGKEIYEGDILKYFLSDSHGSMSGDQFVLGDVFFDGGRFMARKLGGIRFDACEIIGNIYENV